MGVTCSICIEPFNKSTRKLFSSPCCPDFDVCRMCVGQYVLGSGQKPSCMKCKTEYSEQTLDTGFTKRFVNIMREAQATLFVESQRSQLPSTMPFIERLTQADRYEKEISVVDDEIVCIVDEYRRLAKIKVDMERYITAARNYKSISQNPDEESARKNLPDHEIEGVTFFVRCAHDNCRGYLSKRYKCAVCNRFTCPRCHKKLLPDDNHVCVESDMLSVEEIKRSTKACPACGARIHKISGCSQMFCTKEGCGTIFDWNTLRIQIGGIQHNPHIWEYRERYGIPHENGTNGCDQDITDQHIAYACARTSDTYQNIYKTQIRALVDVARYKAHIEDVEVRSLQVDSSTYRCKILRIKYLQGQINDEEWVKQIKMIHRTERKRNDYLAVLGLVPDILNDLIKEQLDQIIKGDIIYFTKIYEFAILINKSLSIINTKYSVKGILLNIDMFPEKYTADTSSTLD